MTHHTSCWSLSKRNFHCKTLCDYRNWKYSDSVA